MSLLKLPKSDDPLPFDRKRLWIPVKVFLWVVEYVVRVVGMVVLGVGLVVVGLWPRRSATRKVFMILGVVAHEFEERCRKLDEGKLKVS